MKLPSTAFQRRVRTLAGIALATLIALGASLPSPALASPAPAGASPSAVAAASVGATLWPNCGTQRPSISSSFGQRNGRLHAGVDLVGFSIVCSVADGEVLATGVLPGWGDGGYQVLIQHAGYTSRYLHLKPGTISVVQGQQVSAGMPIATMGNSGASDGTHLHLEINPGGGQVDPIPFLTPRINADGPSWVKFDINGDAKADLLATRNDGYLVEFFGNGAGGTLSTYVGGPGWATTAALVTGDFNGDGAGDFMQTRADGGLYFYRGDYASTFTPTYLGAGWASYSLLTGGVDFNSDGRVDLVARGSDSNLYLYPGNGQGSFNSPVQIGTNWSAFTALVAGDFNKDGRGDLMARNSAGELWGYYGTANGFGFIQMLGQGWNGFSSIVSNGDHNGDKNPDIIARRVSDQTLWLYPGNGTGGFGNGVQIGSGWGAYPLIS